MKHIPPPLPILPKYLCADYEPPKCPIRNINFIQLKKFQVFENFKADKMNEGYDQVDIKGAKQFDLGQNGQDPDLNSHPSNPQSYENEMPQFVNNIVFCRDPSILKDKISCLNLKNLMQHENLLDIKQLIKEQGALAEIGGQEDSQRNDLKKKKLLKRQQSEMKMVFDNESAAYQLTDQFDKTLLFESRFESGNLYLAQKVSDNEYNLLMQNDINTSGHTQWFYFRVQNTRSGSPVKFNIINYAKPDSLFNYGMKVTLYSEMKAQAQKIGWHRGCSNISYYPNSIKKDLLSNKTYFTLTFTYDFEYDNDTVFFSYCYPYTYSDLIEDLIQIDLDPLKSQFVSRKVLCKSLAGVNCEYLTVTSREKSENMNKRKAVVISGRVHPGETVGSWMMRGVLKFITDPHNQEAKLLRENFIFKIIPMLNPDGVINGNYRCSLAGCDLNRRWKVPSKMIHPEIYHTKKLAKSLHAERGVVLFCDLHGHSRKQNVFMYGCNNKKAPEETRIFPYLLAKLSPFFSFEYSRFGNQKSKESTARISLFKELKTCPNIFTMESTFSGMDNGPFKGFHITTRDLESLGKDLCRTILVYSDIYVPAELENLEILQKSPIRNANAETLDKKFFKEDAESNGSTLKLMLTNELKQNKELLQKGEGDSSSGSDSAPSEDNLKPEEIIKIIPVLDKKTKQDLQKQGKKKQQKEQVKSKQSKLMKKLPSSQALEKIQPKDQIKKQDTNQQSRKSFIKFPVIEEERKKVEMKEIKEEAQEEEKEVQKKPKPVMVDAWTQTERSDYSLIKSRMLNHQQFANSLIKQQENPLRLKAQKNYQQFARTPTQNYGSIANSASSTQHYDNIMSVTNAGNKNRYNNMIGQSQNDFTKNFRSPQNQRNQENSSAVRGGNMFHPSTKANNFNQKSEVTSQSFKEQSNAQIKQNLNNSQFRAKGQNNNEQKFHSLSIDQANLKKTSNKQNPETLSLIMLHQFQFQGSIQRVPIQQSPLSNPLPSNFISNNNPQPSQSVIQNAKQDFLFPVLRNKYQTVGNNGNLVQISNVVSPQANNQANFILDTNNLLQSGQTEKVLISEKKHHSQLNNNNLSNQKHSSSQRVRIFIKLNPQQRQYSGVRSLNQTEKKGSQNNNTMAVSTKNNKRKDSLFRRNSYKVINSKI